MDNLRFSRQAALVPDLSDKTILFIGVGGIGSNAAHLAASMGLKRITLIDPDEVAVENLAPGFFNEAHVGDPKVFAVSNDIWERVGVDETNIQSYNSLLENSPILDSRPFDIVVISTDTLQSRRMAWENYAHLICNGWWIDARMGGTLTTVFAVDVRDGEQVDDYSDELKDSRPSELPCGEKATAPLTKGYIAGMIGRVLYCIANNFPPPYMQRFDLFHGMMIEGKPSKLG